MHISINIAFLTEIFKSLSDATRLRILNLLSKAQKELCVCELVDSLEVPQYSVSRHLKELEQVNLVSSRKEGRWVYYSLQKNNDFFQKKLMKTVSLVPQDATLVKDLKNLKNRLKMRIKGKCMLGIQKKTWQVPPISVRQ